MEPYPLTPLPKDLEPFRKEGERLFDEGAVRAIEFSRRTYQVLVFDPKMNESFWVFLHLTPSGDVAECFCQCSEELEGDRCPHLVAAVLKIYNHTSLPLHVRYKHSFFKALGKVLYQRKDKRLITPTGEAGKAILKELFHQETPVEESSLKFSDLTENELASVREGDISEQLKFEFSPFSDFAKKLILWNEETPLKIHFEQGKEKLPLHLQVEAPQLVLDLRLTEKELSTLIPTFNTLQIPLRLRGGFKDFIEKAEFDEKKGVFHLTKTPFRLNAIQGEKVGDWLYVKGEGFYPLKIDPLLEGETVASQSVEPFLERFHSKLGSWVHPGLFEKKGRLYFDKKEALHLAHFLFTPGDLEASGTHVYGSWVYLSGKGFFKTLVPHDLPKEGVIKKGEVYEWVLSHPSFLAGQPGFKLHVKELESFIEWELDNSGALLIKSLFKGNTQNPPKEFGGIVYVEGEGFFSKASYQDALSVKGGLKVSAMQVPSYIRNHEADLRVVTGFFVKSIPVEKATLAIRYEGGKLIITPKIELIPSLKERKMRLYDEYLYVEGEGFYALPEKHFLPIEYREEKVIREKDSAPFFDSIFPKLIPFVSYLDSPLKLPTQVSLTFHNGLFLKSELGEVSFRDFITAAKKGKRYFLSPAGRLDLHEARFHRLSKLFKEGSFEKPNLIDIYKLKAFEETSLNPESYSRSLPLDYTGLKSTLRPYQEAGVKWLWSLYSNSLSGLLCDDMGLGKTHQAMALMAAIKNHLKVKSKVLIVCPTSVLFHWEEKLAAFLPGYKVLTYHGLARSLEGYEEEGEILLTSYGILRRDIERLKKWSFELAIYDEIQIAKNHLSRLWVTLKEIKATMTLGLSGTPIENHLRELKSLFDIVLPSLMPGEADYNELFVKPIEKGQDAKTKALLHRFIQPFLLRRKKEEVLLDLPEKTEEIAHNEMLPEQKSLYHSLYLSARNTLLPDLLDESKAIPYIHIFALISGLKKVANHPALYLKKGEDYKHYPSGKWELFTELLQEALGSEQKVVVFSHFLGMLDIIESYLAEEGIGYTGLRGSTVDRKERIQRFQTDPDCKVFVASLQAGGLGIDLTQASVVIHYDRWWNAARENQATDRVHRIGQKRGVQVFKLVTVHSIEERIHELIEKKQRLMEEIVGKDGTDVIKSLTREELIRLFEAEE